MLLMLLQSFSGCDPNPTTRNYLASPAAVDAFKVMVLKIVLVFINAVLGKLPSTSNHHAAGSLGCVLLYLHIGKSEPMQDLGSLAVHTYVMPLLV